MPRAAIISPEQSYRAHLKSIESCVTMKGDVNAKENELLKQFN